MNELSILHCSIFDEILCSEGIVEWEDFFWDMKTQYLGSIEMAHWMAYHDERTLPVSGQVVQSSGRHG
jgi:hypothetical protein